MRKIIVQMDYVLPACVITGTVNGSAQYELSKAIIITFYISNHVDKEQNKPAEQWETA